MTKSSSFNPRARLIDALAYPHRASRKSTDAVSCAIFGLIVAVSLVTAGCVAMQPRETMLVQQSRFGELERLMEGRIEDQAAAPTAQLFYLCFAHSKVKHYSKLFPCLEHLQRNIDQGDFRLYWFDFSAAPALMRAEAFMEFGDYAKAISEARTAYRLTKTKKAYLQIKIYALTAVALAHALNGDRKEAESFAAELEAVETGYPNNLMASDKYTGLAKVYMALRNYPRALAAIKKDEETQGFKGFVDLITGASLAGQSLFTYWELPKRYMLNKSLLETGEIAAAKAGYDQLLQFPQTADNGDIYWLILLDRGRIAELEGDRDEAIDFYRRAIEVIEQQRSTINTEASKIGFVGDKQDVYKHIISPLLDAGRHAEAFEYTERAKARALVDMLAERQRFAPKELDSREIRKMLAQLAELEATSLVQEAEIDATQRTKRRRAVTKAREKIVSAAPELASLVTVLPLSAAEIQGLIGYDEALVEYFYEDDELVAFMVTREAVRGIKLDGGDLGDLVGTFRVALSDHKSDAYLATAQKLYRRLVAPLVGMLGRPKLTIVPHGELHYLPFSALHDGRAFLIDRFAVRLLPSGSVLKYLKGRGKPAPQELLVFGNPDLGDPKWDLRGAEAEALEIARRRSGSTVLLGRKASETVIKKVGGQFRYLHLASHGKFNSDRPLESGILLAGDGENDGRLTVSELYDLKLNADLATLSACETGLGALRNGDDVVGLTRGFLYAGARAIVASLWPVSDEATYDLMTEFYAKLQLSGKRDALRAAQREAREKYPHPFFWAAFQITGDA